MSEVLEERAGPVLILTLNAPERRNPISDEPMIAALIGALDRADRDPEVHAAVLTGAGPAFSSGGDVRKMGPGGGLRDAAPVQTRRNYRAGIQRLPLFFQALDLPVVAAVNGPAIGAGCDLACMCDLRVAGRSARFAESFVKLGLIPGDGGAWLLQRIVGISKASEMALTGEAIDAEQALACGLVSQVVADEELLPAALALANAIAANPPHATRLAKRLLREAQTSTLAAALELAATAQALMHDTAEHEAALRAMLERRPAR